MNILYDSAMPYAAEFFNQLGHAVGFEAGSLPTHQLATTDILLVRSTTDIDQDLLDKMPNLKLVATATAGFDHFDTKAIEKRHIQWQHAPGCNARAVAEYVLCGLLAWANKGQFLLSTKSISVVGVGEVGKRVSKLARALGMNVVEYDPPRAIAESDFESAKFADVLKTDVISLHVPLVCNGEHATKHLLNAEALHKLNPEQLLINACRGEVIEHEHLKQNASPTLIFDCWANEPEIDKQLIPKCMLATAHIAGHSLEGKATGTETLYVNLCAFMRVNIQKRLRELLPEFKCHSDLSRIISDINQNGLSQSRIYQLCKCFYDIEDDDSVFRRYMANSSSISDFRRNYPIRREFDAIKLPIEDIQIAEQLSKLGFNTTENYR